MATKKNIFVRYMKCLRRSILNIPKVCYLVLKRLINVSVYDVLVITLPIFVASVFIYGPSIYESRKYLMSEDENHENEVTDVVNDGFDRSIIIKNSRNPVIVWWTDNVQYISETIYCGPDVVCDLFQYKDRYMPADVGAYLFYALMIDFDDLPLPRRPKDIIWAFIHEESPNAIQELTYEPVLNLFNFSATFSRYSDVPYPLLYIGDPKSITNTDYFVETAKKNSYLGKISSILYLQSDCRTSTERDIYVEKLMEYINVDSYGACLKNKILPQNLSYNYLQTLYHDDTLKFLAKYKFVIAIENAVCDDYITEKFWRAIKVGTVPIYFGSPSIRDWLPNKKSAILLADYPTPKLMSEHIKRLLANDSLYEEHLEHKIKGIITNKRLLYELRVRPYQSIPLLHKDNLECEVCKSLYEKKENAKIHTVDILHYNCSPISALELDINPNNGFVYTYNYLKPKVENWCNKIMNGHDFPPLPSHCKSNEHKGMPYCRHMYS